MVPRCREACLIRMRCRSCGYFPAGTRVGHPGPKLLDTGERTVAGATPWAACRPMTGSWGAHGSGKLCATKEGSVGVTGWRD